MTAEAIGEEAAPQPCPNDSSPRGERSSGSPLASGRDAQAGELRIRVLELECMNAELQHQNRALEATAAAARALDLAADAVRAELSRAPLCPPSARPAPPASARIPRR